jgi:hypothetical protein
MIIARIEQFEATISLLNILENLSIKSAEYSHYRFTLDEGRYWQRCVECEEYRNDCICDEDRPGYYAEYDDEASY